MKFRFDRLHEQFDLPALRNVLTIARGHSALEREVKLAVEDLINFQATSGVVTVLRGAVTQLKD
jgi:hypothetical protein